MIKLVYGVVRRADLSEEAFLQYWREVHGPIATQIPGLRRLVQSRTIPVSDTGRRRFDGFAELWFDDREALLAARRSAAWSRSTADEANFLDPERCEGFVVRETEIEIPGVDATPSRTPRHRQTRSRARPRGG